jgi:signal peptide peptidase SppA
MGHWLAESVWLNNTANAIKGGYHAEFPIGEVSAKSDVSTVADGIAVLEIDGMMLKGASKFGGTSTVALRNQIRKIKADDSIKKVLIHADSGGGLVAGTKELADDIASLNEEKEVVAFIEDLGASACYWACSQASKIVANATAEIGSLGTVAVVADTSEAYQREGVKVHVISTGEFKGAMSEGTEITEPMLQDMQERVNDINEIFMNAVADGRGMERETVNKIADGRVFIASKAMKLGLIDEISTLDAVIGDMQKSMQKDTLAERQGVVARKLQGK